MKPMIVPLAARSGRLPPHMVVESVFNLVHATDTQNNQTFTISRCRSAPDEASSRDVLAVNASLPLLRRLPETMR
jgi:hypothetical protein